VTFDELLGITQTWPLIESRLLWAYGFEKRTLAVQLSRWTARGRLERLRRGLYMLREPYLRVRPSREYVANIFHRPSFVSFESALAFHGLIPEGTPLVRSITTARPGIFTTALGDLDYRHVAPSRLFGYREVPTTPGTALIATPERALLDILYFAKGPFDDARIHELRLQHHEDIDFERLQSWAPRYQRPSLERLAAFLQRVVERDGEALETL